MGKNEEFRSYLQRQPSAAQGSLLSPVDPESAPARPSHISNEIYPERELAGSLAPEDQPSLGGGSADPADLLALINPPGGVEPAPTGALAPPTHPGVNEVAELVERWVRRVALGGDQRRGVVRLDIGQGRFSGAELLIVAEPGLVSVEVQLPSSVAQAGLSERLRARLERRGYAAEVLVR